MPFQCPGDYQKFLIGFIGKYSSDKGMLAFYPLHGKKNQSRCNYIHFILSFVFLNRASQFHKLNMREQEAHADSLFASLFLCRWGNSFFFFPYLFIKSKFSVEPTGIKSGSALSFQSLFKLHCLPLFRARAHPLRCRGLQHHPRDLQQGKQ